MILLRILLLPFALLYRVLTGLRNYAYDRGLRPVASFDVPVITVGNLTVGGTGKTPMIEHLIRLLQGNHRVATLSRGYGRETRGFRLAGPGDTARTLGDEPAQFYRKFGALATVAVGEDRAFAIPNILQECEDTAVVLLDDAYQHRRVKPAFTILLSDYNRPFYTDLLLPAGRLRESRGGAARADVVVITKCPSEIQEEECIEIEKHVRRYAQTPVFFTTVRYGAPTPFGEHWQTTPAAEVILLTGIAQAGPLKKYVALNYTTVAHLAFADHHAYTTADLDTLRRLAQQHPHASILTTEKDMVKLVDVQLAEARAGLPFFFLPIEVEFVKNGEDFDAMIQNVIARDPQN
jgi:tetraacyldisaccharide 4'-kinase